MRKLMLESLNVESFETAAVPRSSGTVQAHAAPTQNPCYTHEPTCGPTDGLDCTYTCTRIVSCVPDFC